MAQAKKPPSFSDLMSDVAPLRPAPTRVVKLIDREPAPPPPAGPISRRIEVEITEQLVLGRAEDVPRTRIEALRHGPLAPYRELDLHRMSAAKASHALRQSVQLARSDGMRCLVVICGRGSHSGRGGPVLPELVVESLCGELSGDIQRFRTAPVQFGGQGAIIVLLRARPKLKTRSSPVSK